MNLTPEFFMRDTVQVAQDLLGIKLVHQLPHAIISGIIVETEAYSADDPACHAFTGMSERNQALFGPGGHAYIYQSYGIHWCVNVVAHTAQQRAGGVLIRALEPVDGIEIMKELRGTDKLSLLTSGPGRLTQALRITRELYGVDLLRNQELFLAPGITIHPAQIVASARIGISKATDNLWRFYIKENPFVSPIRLSPSLNMSHRGIAR